MSRQFHFFSLHPQFLEAYFRFGVFRAAVQQGLQFSSQSLRQFAVDKHGSVDEAPYGGGDGMVMRVEPLVAALRSLEKPARVLFTSPSGRPWKHADAQRLAESDQDICFISGRFAGVDQRFIDHFVDEEISLGDFVVSGGELPCLMIADSILRLIPGVLGDAHSAVNDSFAEGMSGLLEYPQYTRPLSFEGLEVPAVLLSGDHKSIQLFRQQEVLRRTKILRPDLILDK